MSSGFKTGATDLDDVFDPYDAGTKPGATGFTVAGQDLKDRYNPISEGEAAPATEFSVNGTDLNALFAAKGTSTKALVIPFGSYAATSTGSHDVNASFSLGLNPDGTWAITLTKAMSGSTSGTPLSGAWHNAPAAGVGSDYEVRFTADVSISNVGDFTGGSYTASTGWLDLASAQTVSAQTGHLSSGGSGGGDSTIQGSWSVEIRKKGASAVRRSTCMINISAQS